MGQYNLPTRSNQPKRPFLEVARDFSWRCDGVVCTERVVERVLRVGVLGSEPGSDPEPLGLRLSWVLNEFAWDAK
jgi:hypothetical protein